MKHILNLLITEGNLNRSRILFILCMLFMSATTMFAQKISVSGTVADSNGEPLPGVNILEQGTNNGTITDMDGNFSFNVSDANATISVSFIGYATKDVKVKGKTNLRIVLSEDTEIIDEVVVVGYATQKKATVAAAVSSINNKDLARSTSTTAAGALVGKVSGITARQKSGTPGSAASIQIRNMGTPLYVIDGIMKDEAAFNAIDINDIENISILKDGAAAIYGVKAANGVVLVTTKTGKRDQKPQVNINANMGWQQWTEYPELLNAYQFKWGNYMKAVNSGSLTDPTKIAEAKADLEKWRTGYYNPETGEDYRGYDWKKNFVDNAAPQYYVNANINGGTEKMDYYISIGHISQDAVFKDYNYNRTNLQANFNINLTDNFKVGFQTLGKVEQKVNPALPGDDDYLENCQSLFNLIPTMGPYANNNPEYLNYITPTHDAAHNMAAYTIDNAGKYSQIWRTIQTSLNLEYKTPVNGLTAKGLLSYYYADNNTNNMEKGWKEYTYVPETKEYVIAYDKTNKEKKTYLGKIREDKEEINGQFTLNYNRTFAQDHQVTAVAGFEFYKEAWQKINTWQQPVENIFVGMIGTSENNYTEDKARTFTTASFIFRAGYSYKQKYILDFAGRYDASWRFQKGDQWGFFPSVSGAWRISEEEFFKESKIASWFSSLKLRASYGAMGDDMASSYLDIYDDFAYMPGYNYGKKKSIITGDPLSSGTDNLVTGSQSSGVPITGLTWMKTSILNIGVDFGFLSDRLQFEFDLFRRKRTGIPARPDDITFPLESGMAAQYQNLNSDEISGIDGFVKWNDRISDFKYFVGVNATLARQKNRRSYGDKFLNAWDQYRWGTSDRWSNVMSNSAVWMYETIGIFESQEQIDTYPVNIDGKNNATVNPGDLIYKDINGDGVINEFDARPLAYAATDYAWDHSKGNKQPLLSMGISLGFDWKGIDCAADFAGGFMNTFVADWHVKYGVAKDQTGYVYNVVDAWRHEDIFDPASPWIPGKFPAVRETNPSTGVWNDFYTKEINYLRLRNLVVGYTLPQQWTKKALIQKFRIYFEGTNLLCWDSLKDYGFDPEISTVTGFDYPQHRVYTVGVNVTF